MEIRFNPPATDLCRQGAWLAIRGRELDPDGNPAFEVIIAVADGLDLAVAHEFASFCEKHGGLGIVFSDLNDLCRRPEWTGWSYCAVDASGDWADAALEQGLIENSGHEWFDPEIWKGFCESQRLAAEGTAQRLCEKLPEFSHIDLLRKIYLLRERSDRDGLMKYLHLAHQAMAENPENVDGCALIYDLVSETLIEPDFQTSFPGERYSVIIPVGVTYWRDTPEATLRRSLAPVWSYVVIAHGLDILQAVTLHHEVAESSQEWLEKARVGVNLIKSEIIKDPQIILDEALPPLACDFNGRRNEARYNQFRTALEARSVIAMQAPAMPQMPNYDVKHARR